MKIRFTFEHTMLDPKPITFLIPDGLAYRPVIGDVIDWSFMRDFGGQDVIDNIGEAVFWVVTVRLCTDQYHQPYMHCVLGDIYDRFALIREKSSEINMAKAFTDFAAISSEELDRRTQLFKDG